ncbi:Major facilitator superfamily domain, general substrate transporter [Pseudocohnilembus persalinus]|uniref:Major facilitator superfamily domain, general substrate transporter n=1 Tax=Pseudocohnilembus persalinus TaxID=266149 RepID=A0A0V0QN25_PSEPJ|nr:Major facilitator superfamily domain, general substrate transporter [Pseudocohnilembus persalinus]|eukprot:KRX03753.1 Major facilitator superfamily domain, general substrate transporter [Pseudocohnilembus persalinus]
MEKQLQFHMIIAGVFDLVSYLLYMNLSLAYFRKQVIKYVLVFLSIGHLLFFVVPMYEQDKENENGKIIDTVNNNMIAIYILCFLRVLICGFSNSFLYVYIGEIYPTSVKHYAYGKLRETLEEEADETGLISKNIRDYLEEEETEQL